ncbi:C39 family peptidase [Bacillus anthracis]|uniref:C39 family peptidase n=1 Tax=Bacillus cereus group TaxID=86661 RepID=UPI002DB71A02|nr:C39 family peptidase [Bacillus anthracis]MEB9907818.1 C39 family peptidase [Bacillus anthracis]MEC1955458.1 C39 family peptidase [Bacillus anthracis]
MALLGIAVWGIYTNGITKYVEKLTFFNIQSGKQVEFNREEKIILSNVPFIQQLPELDRGCEVTSLAMMLQYAGITVDKMKLANEIKKVDFMNDGVRGNPNEGFVGNIYTFSESGYGVYHGPLFQLAKKYLPNKAVDLTGKSIEELYKSVKAGQPVVMITNATFAPLDEDEFTTWETNNGDVSITYNEHCVVLIGYDQESVYIRDPLKDSLDVKVPREKFEQAWVQMGSQAISYMKSSK